MLEVPLGVCMQRSYLTRVQYQQPAGTSRVQLRIWCSCYRVHLAVSCTSSSSAVDCTVYIDATSRDTVNVGRGMSSLSPAEVGLFLILLLVGVAVHVCVHLRSANAWSRA